MKYFVSIAAALSLIFTAHAADKVTYEDHIKPIFQNACFSCHNADKTKAGLNLTNFTAMMAGGSGGEVLVAGDPGDSTLYLVVTHEEEPKMPPKGNKLADDQLALIKKWIEGGLLETASSKAIKKKKSGFNLALATAPTGKPEGPPPMPEHLLMEPVVVTERSSAVASIATSPWAPLAAITGQKQVLLYNTDSLELVGVLPFPEGFPETLRFSRNGALLLAGGGRGGALGRAVVWDIKSGRRVIQVGEELDSVLAADISADQTQITLGGPSRMIRVYDTEDGQLTRSVKKHTDWITAVAYSNDGVLVATGDRGGGLYVWESYTGGEFYTLNGHKGAITSLDWRSDSNVLASSSEDGSVRLWEMFNGKQVKSWTAHGGGTLSVDFTSDNKLITAGRDQHTKLWDQNGKQLHDLGKFSDLAQKAAVTHDAKRAIAGDWTGEIRVWNTADGKQIGKLAGNPPALATRLSSAQQSVAKLTPVWQQADAAYKAAQTATDTPRKDYQEAAKTVEAAAKAVKEAQAAVDGRKASAVKAAAAHGEAIKMRDAKTAELAKLKQALADASHHRDEAKIDWQKKHDKAVSKSTLTEKLAAAAAAAGAEAGKAPEDKALADTAAKSKAAADAAAKDLATAQADEKAANANHKKLVAAASAANIAMKNGQTAQQQADKLVIARNNELKAANEMVLAAQATMTAATAKAAEKSKLAAERGKILKDAESKAAAAKAAADKALAQLNSAKNTVARWQAEQINVQRLAVRDQMDAAQAEHDALADVTAAAQAVHNAAAASLNAAKKALADAPGIVKQKQEMLAKAQAAAKAAKASLDSAVATANEKDAFAKQHEQTAKQLAARAAANADNKQLASAAAKVNEALALLRDDAAAARSVIGGLDTQYKTAVTASTGAEKPLAQAKAALAAAPGIVETRTKTSNESKAKLDAAAADQKKAADQLAAIKAKFDKLTADYLAKLPK